MHATTYAHLIEYENWNEVTEGLSTSNFGFDAYADSVQDAYSKEPDSILYFKQTSLDFAEKGQPSLAIDYFRRYASATGDLSLLNDHIYDNIKTSSEYVALKETYTPRISILSIIYIYAGLLGFYIFVVLNLKRKTDRMSTILISFFVLFHSMFILHLSTYIINYQYYLPHTLFISTTFSFFYGPLLYFYFKRVMCGYKFRWIDLIHLVPSVVLFMYIMPYYTMSSLEKFNVMFDQNNLLLPGASTIIVVKILSLSTYAFLIIRMYLANMPNAKKQKDIFIWQRNIIAIFVIYIFAYIIYAGIISEIINLPELIHFQIFVMVALVFYVAYISYVQPQVFKGELKLVDPMELFKYQNSGLTPAYSEELKVNLLQLLDEEKIYKRNNINMEMLSEMLGTSRHNTSQVINEHFDMNFFELINKYRVNEALEMLKDDSNGNLSMIDIAYEVGFNNKVTFNKSFKKYALQTPTQFLKSVRA